MDQPISKWQNPRKQPRRRAPAPAGWLDLDDAAKRLMVSSGTVARRVSAGALAGSVVAGRTVVSEESVRAYAAAMAKGEIPRDLRRLRGEDRPSTSWNDRYPNDAYVQTREG